MRLGRAFSGDYSAIGVLWIPEPRFTSASLAATPPAAVYFAMPALVIPASTGKNARAWRCPSCASPMMVKGAHIAPEGSYRRRRLCPKCGARFTTAERIIGQDATPVARIERVLAPTRHDDLGEMIFRRWASQPIELRGVTVRGLAANHGYRFVTLGAFLQIGRDYLPGVGLLHTHRSAARSRRWP